MNPEQQPSPIHIPRYEEETPPPRHSRRRGESVRSFLSTVGVVLLAIGFAVLLTMYVFQSYQVDGPSMEPTLHDRDRLIIWKTPRTVARITGNIYIPDRGDIIVFNENSTLGSNGSTKQLIKRVIGLPGDRIVVEDGLVTVYNSENPDGFNPDITLDYADGKTFPINNNEEVDVRVEADRLFVMGDNRNNSQDSRSFGTIHANEIVGKLTIRIFPIGDARGF